MGRKKAEIPLRKTFEQPIPDLGNYEIAKHLKMELWPPLPGFERRPHRSSGAPMATVSPTFRKPPRGHDGSTPERSCARGGGAPPQRIVWNLEFVWCLMLEA